jgi:hypothetical protein
MAMCAVARAKGTDEETAHEFAQTLGRFFAAQPNQ